MSSMVVTALFLWLTTGSSGQWALQSGTKVSVLFVKPSEKIAWRPDGTPFELATLPPPVSPIWTGKETEPILTVLTNAADRRFGMPTVKFKLPDTEILPSSFGVICAKQKIWISGLKCSPGQPAEQDVAVGVSEGGWSIAGSIDCKLSGKAFQISKRSGYNFKPTLSATTPAHSAGPFTMVIIPTPHGFQGKSIRLVALDRFQSVFHLVGSNLLPDRPGYTNYTFQADGKQVSRVELQTRGIEWHTIKVAHFLPGT